MYYKFYYLTLCLLFINLINAQAQDSISSNAPIQDEFSELIESSNNYQGYKVVDYDKLIALRNSTKSYIQELKQEITVQKNTADQQNDEISSLKNKLKTTQGSLEKVTKEKDAIMFLGMPFSKGGYMAMMWGIVALLLVILFVLFFRHRSSHATTREARAKLKETDNEFDLYKKKALEKEQRLGRQLQDERNKNSNS